MSGLYMMATITSRKHMPAFKKIYRENQVEVGTVSLVSEKELVLIVARSEQKNAIMQAIMEKAGITSKAGTIVFSLPVTDTAGLRILEDTEENQ